jgi:16S rRNA (guanine966-N2)-methyltransferase
MTLRIIGGELKGRKLVTVRGLKTRPTADRVRESIFNILGNSVRGARVLDLYAGTGAMGIEALSTGEQGQLNQMEYIQ